jgi:hypothetical protein
MSRGQAVAPHLPILSQIPNESRGVVRSEIEFADPRTGKGVAANCELAINPVTRIDRILSRSVWAVTTGGLSAI